MSRRRTKASAKPKLGKSIAGGVALGVGLFAITLVLAVFGIFSAAKNYIRSEAFREKLAGLVSENLKAAGQIETVSWQDSSAFTDRLTARGYEDAGFAKLDLAGVRAQLDVSLGHFKRGVWKIPEVTVSQLDLTLSEDRLPGVYADAARNRPDSSAGGDEEASGGGLTALLPKKVEIDATRITNLNLYWQDSDKQVRATGIQTVVEPTSAQNALRVQCSGGTIQGRDMPTLEVNDIDFNWTLEERAFYISRANLGLANSDARLKLDGEVKLGNDAKPGSLLLRSNLTNLNLSELVDENWQRRLQGQLTVEATLTGDPENLTMATQKGSITLDNGIIEAFPVLDLLGTYTKNERFRRIALRDGGSADFTRQGGRVEVRNISLQSDGLAKLEGSLDIVDGQLEGVLKLGVVPGTLRLIPGAERKVFVDSREGHLWTDVHVSGSVNDPQHDLVAQLRDAGVEAAMDYGKEVIKNPMRVKDDAIKMGTDLLKGIFK